MEQPSPNIPAYQIPGTPAVTANVPGVTPEQIAQFQLAELRAKPIRRAVSVARTDAIIGIILAVTATMSVCIDWSALFIGPAIGFIAWNSLRGARRLRNFDPAAPAILAWNQVILAAIITVYCLLQIWIQWTGKSNLSSDLAANGISGADMEKALGIDFVSLERKIYLLFYGLVIAGSLLFQGLTALYYRSRRRLLNDYLQQTPPWIIELQKSQKS